VQVKVGSGAAALYTKKSPTNVCFARAGVDLQIEVYDPLPARGRGVVVSQSVTPVG
jgi:hypothetical protein